MIDFAAARRMMVDCQVRTSDVTAPRVIAAMLEVPRELFAPKGRADLAYLDLDLPLTEASAGGPARCLLKPMVLAKLLQGAEIAAGDRVLDVGCGTGYSSAVLARLSGAVVALEVEPSLARSAADNLRAPGAGNVTVVTGPMIEGWPAGAPYDVILLNGATEIEPQALLRQLKDGGRLVGVRGRAGSGKAMLYRAVGGEVSGRPIFDATAPLLPGFAESASFVF
jgi:protein-L-isoaspartate(D-aspartate) O-methyltransferase